MFGDVRRVRDLDLVAVCDAVCGVVSVRERGRGIGRSLRGACGLRQVR